MSMLTVTEDAPSDKETVVKEKEGKGAKNSKPQSEVIEQDENKISGKCFCCCCCRS